MTPDRRSRLAESEAIVEVADGPIDLAATLDGGQAFRWWPDDAGPAGSYRGVLRGRVVRISPIGADVLVTALDGRPAGQAAELVADHLKAGSGLEEFRRQFQADPALGTAIRSYPGLRLLRQEPWECLVCYLCSATSNVKRIKGNARDLSTTLGRKVGTGEEDFEFPTPVAVAEAGERTLRDLMLGFRAKYLARAAETVAAGGLDLDSMRTRPYDDAKEELVRLEGVADKIADCVLAFSLDKPEAFPVDIWVRRAVKSRYGLPERCNDDYIRAWAEDKFGPHRALASQFLFYREWLTGGRG